jgi:hypothetical protein
MGLRKMSSKKAAEIRKWGPVRLEYLSDHPICPVTGGTTCDVHEIAGGSYRHKSYPERCAWLAVSRLGHEQIQGKPYAYQLAFKLLQDPTGFDLDKFYTEILGTDEAFIPYNEILEESRKLLIVEAQRYQGH